MRKNFIELSTDEAFKSWVLAPNEEKNVFWEKRLKNDPELASEAKKAKEIILRLKFKQKPLDEESKDKILDFVIQNSNRSNQDDFGFPQRGWGNRKLFILKLVASVALILGCFYVYNTFQPKQKPSDIKKVSSLIEKKIPKGQKNTFTLSDGSKVKVNSYSKIKFESSFLHTQERKVYLEGEAFFEVVRNEAKPFKVITKNAEIKVLGTSFDVRSYPDHNKEYIAVATGKVEVTSGAEAVYLQPGEMAVLENGKLTVSAYDLEEMLGWESGILFYKEASFEKILQKLEFWYGVEFEISGTKPELTRYSGNYKNQSLKTILEGLSFAAGFDYKIQDKKVKIIFK
ncbi:FecR family protein [Flexithrix dorotheae]|uniref:FecR family protein n=1 Tax=Flexithrix dorotheae TaxID=70993 RepID=UPI0003820D31|nr:FecR family protein [Flexithrix dorotheae]